MSSGLATQAAALKSAIESGWARRTPIAWPNVSFVPPSDEAWLGVDVLWAGAAIATMGGAGIGSNQLGGLVQLAPSVPRAQAAGELLALVDACRDLFNRKTIGACRFGAAGAPVPYNAGEDWYSVAVRIDFDLMETI